MAEKELRPGILRRDLKVIRGETPMLFDPQADAYYRLPENASAIPELLDREQSFEELLRKIQLRIPGFSAEELNKMLLFFRRNGLFEPLYGEMGARRRMMTQIKEKSRFMRWASAYLFFRLPPWHPEKFFAKISPGVSFLASKGFILLLLIPAVLGYVLALQRLSEVRDTFVNTLMWAGLVKYFAVICLVKTVHEAAHSLAAIHFNCRVRGIGLGFMVFYPRLYTDTTDSYRLSRRKRLLIDSAGMIAELLMGGIAALLWVILLPGAMRSTMFYIFAVSTASTLLVNGNPLIRYDGYYILCDLLKTENLMQRSAEQLKSLWHTMILKPAPPMRKEHRIFFSCYGIASFLYRITLYTSIILLIYYKFAKVPAVILLLLEIWVIALVPLFREFREIRVLKKEYNARLRWLPLFGAGALAGGILFLPLSWETDLPGVTVPRDEHFIIAAESGFLTARLPKSPRIVRKGEVLFELHAPKMLLAQKRLEAELAHDQELLRLQQLDAKELSGTKITAEKVAADRLALKELRRRMENLRHTAPAAGYFVTSLPELSQGASLPRTITVGRIISAQNKVYAYAAESEVGNLNVNSEAKVRFPDSLAVYAAKIVKIDKLPRLLKNSPLLQQSGGPIPYYPAPDDPAAGHSQQPLYKVELHFTGTPPPTRAGRTVLVSVINRRPLAKRVADIVIGAFRREF